LPPLRSASFARLHTGEEVAVKVQRPHLHGIFDISVLRRITNFLARFPQLNENADWEGMLGEFSETIHEEMDYAQEGRNADRFRESFKDWRAIMCRRFTGRTQPRKCSRWSSYAARRLRKSKPCARAASRPSKSIACLCELI
jgi:hypothetical protein